ncbi:LOW QUALITY PROTEIN: hypothetical protein HZS_3824 [Henneguya salminicola]|nr:LOW QUALITY PROTEIN: hypothetical protein HZS_3824 [Henneguya salminicola]
MKNCKRIKILKALLIKTGVNFGNISAEYGLRNIRLEKRTINITHQFAHKQLSRTVQSQTWK